MKQTRVEEVTKRIRREKNELGQMKPCGQATVTSRRWRCKGNALTFGYPASKRESGDALRVEADGK